MLILFHGRNWKSIPGTRYKNTHVASLNHMYAELVVADKRPTANTYLLACWAWWKWEDRSPAFLRSKMHRTFAITLMLTDMTRYMRGNFDYLSQSELVHRNLYPGAK